MRDKYFSVEHEPALSGGPAKPDPAESRAAPVGDPPSEIEALRDSVASEPALPQRRDPIEWTRWLEHKRGQCSMPGNLAVTLLAALVGGPFAILGAIYAGQQGWGPGVYAVVFAPVIEELLKQSGMIFVLEKKPYRVFASWQFLFAALVSGFVFGAIENLVYVGRFAAVLTPHDLARLAAYRWTVCTSLHVVCAAIASRGLVRVWQKHARQGGPVELTPALPWFVVAMVMHGLYNLSAVFWGPEF